MKTWFGGFLSIVGKHPILVDERQPGGRLERSLKRDRKLQAALEGVSREDGIFEISGDLLASFQRVFIKTVQGLYFGLYNRLSVATELELLSVSHIDQGTPEEAIARFQPNILADITDEPLSEITPSELAYPTANLVLYSPRSRRPAYQESVSPEERNNN